jgi:hypothetical protein
MTVCEPHAVAVMIAVFRALTWIFVVFSLWNLGRVYVLRRDMLRELQRLEVLRADIMREQRTLRARIDEAKG